MLLANESVNQDVLAALGCIPNGLFVVTSTCEDRRGGQIVRWVQRCCDQPPMISMSLTKGKAIMPLISESRRFALCQLSKEERILARKFSQDFSTLEDPFLGLDMIRSQLGLPILAQSVSYLECELACHMDVEGDRDLFVGLVLGGRYIHGEPAVEIHKPNDPDEKH